MSAGLAAWIAHITFAVVLFLGWDELGLSRVVFVLLWLAGFAAQHVITSGPVPALFAPSWRFSTWRWSSWCSGKMSSSANPAGPVAVHAAREAVAVLREHYGRPPRLFSHDPFELILLENLAYLASWSRRCEAFEELSARWASRLPLSRRRRCRRWSG